MQESQLEIIKMLNYTNPNFSQSVLDICDKAALKRGEKVQTLRQITDSNRKILSTAKTADEDTVNYIKQISKDVHKQAKRPT